MDPAETYQGALERMMQFHESVEDDVTTGLRELSNFQATNEAQEMQLERSEL